MTWSIRSRLTAWFSFVVVVVLAIGAIAVAAVQERLAYSRLDGELERFMLTLEGVMRTEFGEGLDLAAAANEASTEVVAPDHTLMVAAADGRVVEVWGRPLGAAWQPPVAGSQTGTLVIGKAYVRALSRSVTYGEHHYVAAVIAPLEPVEAEYRELLVALIAGVLVALAVAGIGGWLVAEQSLRPLGTLSAQAATITERDLSGRLHPPHTDDELGRLAKSFNAVLDRLAAALHSQRQFMADASHELRTPVSVVHTTAQVILAQETRSEQEYRESMSIVEEQSTRLKRLVEAMFMLSRAEAHGLPIVREPLYVDDLVAECARALRVLAAERGVTITQSGDVEVQMAADPGLLKQLIVNLLDNAIRHARGAVTAAVARHDGDIVIRVTDDGGGIAPQDQDRIFERFVRLDGASRGAGLGLPIARWIADAHGGTLSLEWSGPTGSCFAVRLPVASAPQG